MGKSNELTNVDTSFPVFDSRRFFEAMCSDPVSAIEMVGNQISDEGYPSPKAEAYVERGEWDLGKVTLSYIAADSCLGTIGEGDSDLRFCGLRKCTVKAHQGARWPGFRPGWYIHSGKARGGCFRTSCFQSATEGGPISSPVAKVLSDPVNPFRLSVGQWKFVLDQVYSLKFTGSTPESDGSFDRLYDVVLDEVAGDDETEDDKDAVLMQVAKPSSTSNYPLVSSSGTVPGSGSGTKPKLKTPPKVATAFSSSTATDPAVLKAIFEALEDRIDALQHRVTQSESEAVSMKNRAVAAEASLSSLRGKLSGLSGIQSKLTGMEDEITELKDAMSSPSGQLTALREQVDGLTQSSKVGSSVSRHGVTLSHPGDAPGLLMSIGGNVGIFHDVTSLLHSIAATSISHKTSLTEMKAQRDVKLVSDIQARVITSFRTNLPAILYGGSSSVDAVEDYVTLISKLKSYSMWHNDDGMSGVSQRILNGANEVAKRVQFLANRLTSNPVLLGLSTGTVLDSLHFIRQFIAFIDATYIEYRASTFFTDAQVWEVLVSFIEQVFDDVRRVRCEVQDAAEDEPSFLLWGILRAHDVMDTYLRHEFKNHPAIVGILVHKVLRSSPASKVQGQQSKVDGLDNKLKSLTAKVSSLETKTSKMPAHPS